MYKDVDQAHHHILRLANAVSPVYTLVVQGRVPGGIQDDDSISSCQGQAKAAYLGGQQEDWNVSLCLESVYQDLQQGLSAEEGVSSTWQS